MDRKETVVLLLSAAALVLGVGCYDTARPADISSSLPAANCDMATLQGLYDGRTRQIEDDLLVVGRITSTDAGGNFYKSFTVEDGQGAVEVMAGLTRLDASYPEGAAVAIRLRGCALGCSRGVMQIGRMPVPGSGYATDYFPVRAILEEHVVRGDDIDRVEPRSAELRDLSCELCGCLVRIDALHLCRPRTDDGLPALWSGYALFKDAAGDSIVVYTRPYAVYADNRIPFGEVSLVGILQYGTAGGSRECYQLKMRYEEDCIAR